MKYILYTRTSTNKQELGLDAQRNTAKNFISDGDTILQEYTEQESGRRDDRPQLIKAIAATKDTGATLLIANLSRLSRSVKFTYDLMDSDVRFVCCDMPNANPLTIGIMAVIAQDFAQTLSDNTKRGIAASKAKGVIWGTNNLTRKGTLLSASRRVDSARQANAQGTKIIRRLRREGKTFLEISNELNADGYTTSTGGKYCERTVNRLHKRAN